jgi:hypothetical protein
LPRTLHLPSRPTTRLRVAPYPASFGRAGDEAPGCPDSSVHSAVPGMDLRVASNLASFNGTVDETPGCPDSSLCGIAYDESPGCPEFCIFRLCRQWISELPRISHPSAVPVVKLRVAPALRSSDIASDEVPGCPDPCILRPRLVVLQVTLDPAPSGCAIGESPGCPESSLLWPAN